MITIVAVIQMNVRNREQNLLNQAYENVKSSYGVFYIPSLKIEPATLASEYGISFDSVESYFGEAAMMSTYPDVFIGIKARKGHTKNISDALTAYREQLLIRFKDAPSSLAKVNASRVYVSGDYIFYMALGQPSDTVIIGEEIIEHVLRAEETAAIGIEQLNRVFNGQ